MANKLYVGNLSGGTTGLNLSQLFAQHGAVDSAEVICDLKTGESKRFGFVQMASAEQGKKAMEALDGKDYDGSPLNVKLAHPPRNPRAAHAAPNLNNSAPGSR